MVEFHQATGHSVENLDDIMGLLKPRSHSVVENKTVRHFAVHSKLVGPGDVYVAIKGARVDGHRFVAEALEKGAAACLVETPEIVTNHENCILVPNSVHALGYLAACHRRSLRTRIIALTGSVGKTTTKDILYQLLSATCIAARTMGNFNSTIGLPLQLLRLRGQDDWMVVEMGMSTPGEIKTLMDIAKPDVGLWTSVRPVHLANFDSLDGIARAKAELVEGLGRNNTLVFNLDDPLVTKYAAKFPGKKITYSLFNPNADVQAHLDPMTGWGPSGFTLRFPEKKPLRLSLPLIGRFNVYNAVAACTTAWAIGFEPTDFILGMRQVRPSKRRTELHLFDNGTKLVDDSYNANPHAFDQVLRSFASLAPCGYRWLICGDMLELGDREVSIHRQLGMRMANFGFDRVTFVGPLSRHTYSAFSDRKTSSAAADYFPTTDEALEKMELEIPAGSRIWIKASRGIHLDRLADHLVETLEAAEKAGP